MCWLHLLSLDRASEESGVWTVIASQGNLICIVVAMSSPVAPMLWVLTHLHTGKCQTEGKLWHLSAPEQAAKESWVCAVEALLSSFVRPIITVHLCMSKSSSFSILGLYDWILDWYLAITAELECKADVLTMVGAGKQMRLGVKLIIVWHQSVPIITLYPDIWVCTLPEYSLSRTVRTHQICRHSAPDGNIHSSPTLTNYLPFN